MKTITTQYIRRGVISLLLSLTVMMTHAAYTGHHATMTISCVSTTPNKITFDVMLTNDGTSISLAYNTTGFNAALPLSWYAEPVVSGTITASTASTAVVGTGTSFLSQLQVGGSIFNSAGTGFVGVIASISSNTSLTLLANSGTNILATAAYRYTALGITFDGNSDFPTAFTGTSSTRINPFPRTVRNSQNTAAYPSPGVNMINGTPYRVGRFTMTNNSGTFPALPVQFLLTNTFWTGAFFVDGAPTTTAFTNTNVTFKIDIGLQPTGTITASNASPNIVGVGTNFLTELQVNNPIYGVTGNLLGTVASIGSNTTLTLTANSLVTLAAGSQYRYFATVCAIPACNLSFAPPTLVPPPCGGTIGSITANPTAGTPPYTYLWSPGGATTQTISATAGVFYTVVIKDASNCTVTSPNNVVNAPSPISASETHTDVQCVGFTDGTATITVTGGVAPYTVTLNPGAFSQPVNTDGGNTVFTGLGAGSYTYSVTDAGGCPPFTGSVTINAGTDNTPPVITCPADAAFSCENYPAATGVATATDNCDPNPAISSTDVTVNLGCPYHYRIDRTWKAMDASGNSSTCVQTITITDNTPPTFTSTPTTPISVSCDAVPAMAVLTGTDNCGTTSVTTGEVRTNGNCPGNYTLTRTFTLSDECGNTATATQVINVSDTQAPTITSCPAGGDLGCNPPGGVPAPGTVIANDNCGTITYGSSLGSITSTGCMRSQTRTYTATDDCNNVSTCTQTFTWTEDTEAPTFTSCPSGSDLGCNPPRDFDNTFTSNTSVPIPDNNPVGASSPIVVSGVPTASLGSGQLASVSINLLGHTFDGDLEIRLVGPNGQNLILSNNRGSSGSDFVNTVFTPTATTPIASGSAPFTGTFMPDTAVSAAAAMNKFVGVDPNGIWQLYVVDQANQDIGTIDSWSIHFAGSVTIPAAGGAVATDNCGTPNVTNVLGSVVSTGCSRSQTRTYTATDGCGNTATCNQTFTWTEDTDAPVFTACPAGSDLGCNPTGGLPAAGGATASDNCGTPTITDAVGSVTSNGCNRSQTRTYTATDGCGNTATCNQTFTWTEDTEAPVFTLCPAGSDLGCNIPAAASQTFSTNSPVLILDDDPAGSYSSISVSGVPTASLTTGQLTSVKINSLTHTWDSDIEIRLVGPNGENLVLSSNRGGSGDNYTNTEFTPSATTAIGAGSPPFTGTFKPDTSVSAADAMDKFVGVDPNGTWQLWVVDGAGGDDGFIESWELTFYVTPIPAAGGATASDNCGDPTITDALGSEVASGCTHSVTRTYTATDGCGNTATCNQTFTWTVDTDAPVFTACPSGGDLGCNPSGVPAAGGATATDNCGTATITDALGSITSNGCNRSQTRTYTATDGCGNSATCTQTFTWTESGAPVLAGVPSGSDLGCNPASLPSCDAGVTASNDCGSVPVTCTPGAITNVGSCGRSQTFTYTAIACGLTTSATATYTWTVATAPVLAGVPADADLGCNPSAPSCSAGVTASNECGSVAVTCTAGAISNVGSCGRSQTFTYTASACGLSTSGTTTYTWTVATAPVLAGVPAGSDLGCNPASLPSCDAGVTASNECGSVAVTCTAGAITNVGSCGRSQTFTYSATACGLTSSGTTTYTWTVATAPVIAGVPADADLGCNPASLPSCDAGVTASNECGSVAVTCTAGAISNVGACGRSQTFTYSASACGLSSSSSTTYTWTVATAPVLAGVPADADLGCNPAAPSCSAGVTASNECGSVAVTCTAGAISNVGSCGRSQTFTYSATACGLTSSGTTTYTWTVATAPVLAGVPANADLGCNPASLPSCDAGVTASNECGPVAVTCTPGAITNVGSCGRSQTFTYTAIACGLTSSSTTTYTWTVATAPVLAGVPADADLGCNPAAPSCSAGVTASNECGSVAVTCTAGAISSVGACGRSQTFTYSATACGLSSSASTTYTWTVATAPVLAGVPSGSDLGCNPASLPSCDAGVTASNECGSVAVTCTPGAITNVGSCGRSQTFTYSATACGLTSSSTATYTWTVATAPVIAGVPANADLGCNPSAPSCSAGVTASNECGSVAVTCTPGAITNVGACGRSQTFTYSASACGLSSSATTTYTWTVATAPVLAGVPAGSDLGCNPASLPSCDAGVTASNECGSVAVTCTAGAITNVGSCGRSQTFTYSATACGLTSSSTATYTWTVATAPVIAGVPANADLGCNPASLGSCDAGVTASNECGSVAVTCTAGAISNVGACGRSQTFTYSASACGLSSSASTTYTWTVATAPVLAGVPADADLGCNPATPSCSAGVTASNECGSVAVTCTAGAISNVGSCGRSQTFTYSASACGLSSSATTTYTWTVATAPVLAGVPANADLGCNPASLGSCDAGVTASNECGPVAVTCTPGAITNVGSCGRSQTFTYTAIACGLTSSSTTTYTWTVATAPVLAGVPADADLGCNPAAPSCSAGVTASNECGSVAVTCTAGAISNVGSCGRSQTFTYSATACGLSSSASTTYTWTVATAPVLAGVPSGSDLGCNPASLPSCDAGVTASNECGSVAVTCTPGAITNVGSCGRSQTFTYSATACGLTSSSTATYTWTVATAPVIAGVPANADLGCNPSAPSCSAGVTASNECGSVAVTCTPGAITNVGACGRSQTFTYSASACGLSSSASTTYTWTVATAPVLAGVPADADLGCNPAAPSCSAGVTASNECGSVAVTCTPGAITNVGSCGRSQTFTYTASACGLSTSGTTTYTWTVATAPVLAGVPAGSNLGCNPTTLPSCDAGVTASNECGSVAVTCTPGAITNVGTCGRSQTFTYTAIACGLTSSATSTYTWTEDLDAPVVNNCAPDVSVSVNHAGCTYQLADFRAAASATDACGSVTKSQSPAPGTILGTGPHTVTITFTDGCNNSSSCDFTVTVQSSTLALSATAHQILCFNGTGSVTLTPSGGSIPYTISGDATTGLGEGTYNYTVTDANGCTASASATIDAEPEMLELFATATQPLCAGQTGSVSLSATGGTGAYTFSGAATTGLGVGNYSYTVTDANGCHASATVHINAAPAQLVIHTTVVQPTACTSGSVALSATGGTGAYTFSGDATTGLSAGTYTYTVEDANHCTASTTVTLNTAPSGLSLTATPHDPACNGQLGTVTLVASGGVLPYTYFGSTTGLSAGTYNYTVSDGNGCTATASATINAAPSAIVFTATATQIGCAGGNTGSIALSASGGTPAYTFSPTTTTGLGAGTYTFTVTDSKGCTKTASATINPALPAVTLTATATQPSACVAGSVTLTPGGGSGGYVITGPATTGLSAGTYTYTVADSRGCTATASATINAAPAALNLTATANQILCNGGTGSVTLSASGGTPAYTYSPTTTTGLGAGTYTFTVTDSKGCTKTATATINAAPAAIVFTATATQIACAGGKGSVALSATGGTGAYTYSPVTTTNLSAGTYTYTVTDQNGCTKTASATINAAPTAVSGTATVVNNVCNQSNGSITVTGSGGTPSYSYTLNATTNTSGSFTGLTNGTYTVTVTDSHGCTGTVNATLTCTGSVNCTITASATTICSGSSVTLCAPVVATTTCTKQTETFPNTYNTGFSRNLAGSFTGSTGSWATSSNGGATLVVLTPYYNPSTSYAIKFVNWRTDGVKPDGNTAAYTGIGTATATSPTSNLTTGVCYAPLLTMNFTLWTYTCNASDNTTTLALEFSSNGGSTWTSVWSKTSAQIYTTWGASNKTNIAVPIAASYQTATFKYRFKTNKPSGNAYNFYQFIDDVSITSPSACPNTYLWSPGGATTSCITVSPSSTTTYSVAVTTCTGTGTCSQIITVGTTPSCTITGYLSYCTGGSTSLCAPAGSGLTYAWSTGATTQCISVNSAGTRSVTVRNASGCSSTCSVTVKAPLAVSCSGENPSCSNGFLGSASVSITSNTGLSPFTYRWNTGATTSSISGLAAGTYSITVTDARGCTATCSKTISNSVNSSDYSSIASNFNSYSISSGRYIWFSAVVKVTNSGTYPCTIRFINQNITSSKFNLSPANCKLVLTNSVSTSTTVWTGTEWLTTAPPNLSNNNYFISGMGYQVPSTINANLNPVTWKGIFTTDCPGVNVCWKWAAAVYTSSFGSSYSALNVKPIDKSTGSAYLNSDYAGTPEAKKSYVVAGARGSGSANAAGYVGSYTGTTCRNACSPSICGQNPTVEVVVRTSSDGQTIESNNVSISAYPNPFSSSTTIEFQRSDKACHTLVQVYSLTGELVTTLFDSQTDAGVKYATEFRADDLAEGIYIYKIISGDDLIVGKLILEK